jgi:hypothetical protein
MNEQQLKLIDQIKQRIFQIEALTHQIYKLSKELEKQTTEENK